LFAPLERSEALDPLKFRDAREYRVHGDFRLAGSSMVDVFRLRECLEYQAAGRIENSSDDDLALARAVVKRLRAGGDARRVGLIICSLKFAESGNQ
jgi:hypothetical protein